MSDVKVPEGAGSILRDVLDAWVNRNKRRAADDAGSLTFWRDGMLEQLTIIANGEATDETFAKLKATFEETEEPVAEAIERLREARGKLGASRIADQIDKILNDPRFGKNTIRTNIRYIIDNRQTDLRNTAKWACDGIATLNSEILRLERMVYPDGR